MSRLNAVAAADDDSNNFNVKVKAKTILTQSTFARHYKRKHKCSSKKEDAETARDRAKEVWMHFGKLFKQTHGRKIFEILKYTI